MSDKKANEEVKAEKGNISIHAENILPIIKKWLYSEKEIFLRELVANASDAIQKINKIAMVESVSRTVEEPKITITADKSAGTLTISDTGIGLTAEEVKKYINQVAFSGVSDFVKKYQGKDESEQIIGHFGLGFYSAFMAADKVEISSLSYQENAEPVRWSCDGSTEFSMSEGDKKTVGTDIILHLSEDGKEFLETIRLETLLKKYCMFIRFPIEVEGKQQNEPKPLWTRNPSTVEDKEYKDFFRVLFPYEPEPLFWIHLNMDYPINLKGILYFPKLSHELDAASGQVKLYCNQVFVADNSKELIPEFLTLLKGAIDCPDLPLNVSRSYLQNDPVAQKISKHIVKKVADKLTGLAKTKRADYEKFWLDIHQFIKYGMMREDAFYERMIDHVLFKSATDSDKYFTISEYQEKHKEKLDKKIIYCTDTQAQSSTIAMYKEQDIDVVVMDTMLDNHFIPMLEMKNSDKFQFARVDSEVGEFLKSDDAKDKIADPKDQKAANERIGDLFRELLKREKVNIKVESLKTESIPAMITLDENIRRLKGMIPGQDRSQQKLVIGQDEHTLIVNSNSKAIKAINEMAKNLGSEADRTVLSLAVNQIYDLAFLQQGNFDGEMMKEFIDRSSSILSSLDPKKSGNSIILQ